MFESAELDHRLAKEAYEEQVPQLRQDLLEAQLQLAQDRRSSVVVVVAGVDGAGKGDTVNLLNTWLDPRHVRTYGMGEPTDEEEVRPYFFRFWRRLPPRGGIAIFFGSWYTEPIIDHVFGRISAADLDQAMGRIRRFERMLTDEKTILVKLWFHLSKKQQRKRLKALSKDKLTRWRVTERDWKHFEMYDEFVSCCSRSLRLTGTDNAPWQIIPGAEPRFRQITVGRAVLAALRSEPAVPETPPEGVLHPAAPVDERLVLSTLDLTKTIPKKRYDKALLTAQRRLALLIRDKKFRKRSLVVVFEGADAAGKGGAIRRLSAALDARVIRVVPIAAPTDEEAARPYLWRFWRHIPAKNRVVVFDRSWYGRVLVERVEGLCNPADWLRAYTEINDFEEQLVESGIGVVKLWLHIDPDEQLRRFKEREETGFKRHKITPEDWRNREKWHDYELAVEDMVQRTSTELAPWTLVEANDKPYARVKVIDTVSDAVEQLLK